ncbi:MAG: radical SAM protein [Saprospiraceae bacterium]|nr:radical SAM protein [Saprospiraceae bacterium]
MHIYPIKSLKNCGLFLPNQILEIDNNLLSNLSCYFWKEIFDFNNVKELLEFSSDFDTDVNITENIKSFINSEQMAFELQKHLTNITGIGIENFIYFNSIEIINYLLFQFSEYYYNNFAFTLDNAFDIDANSAKQIIDLAQNEDFNPYYSFLEKHFVPILNDENPEIVFVNGRPGLFNFSQLYFVKKHFPQAYVFLSRHSSEYYSMNKITNYLKTNELLFSWIDGIILDDFKHTESLVEEAIKNKTDLLNIPNLLIKTEEEIIQTHYQKRERSVSEIRIPDLMLEFDNTKKIKSPFEIFETHLLLNNKCHWSSCSYCGINLKYPCKTNSTLTKTTDYLDLFDEVQSKNYKLFVLQDEAINVRLANEIAIGKTARKNNLAWHYRSKIDINYTDEVIRNLAKSNLKGIYFGLESINERVIGLMNKYNKFIEADFIEKLADKLFENNIHCHFCVIIGFPGETREEMQQTLDFISKIKSKHPKFTFTINIFESDISSPIFTNKEKYNLQSKLPVQEDLYIGNILQFEREIPFDELFEIKIKFLLDNISDINSNITEVLENPNSLINYINGD